MGHQQSIFKVTQLEAKTLSWWRTRRSKIDFDPPYQRRGRLWSATDKSYLIDSILNGFDIPKVYVADFTWGDSSLNKKQLAYAIIDGKQRFEAIFNFFDGLTVLNDAFIYREQPSLRLGGLGYQDLQNNHSEIAEAFDNFNLSVISVVASSDELINELFVRLNRSKPLTGAELRNAMAGPVPKVIRTLAVHDFFISNISFSVKRGQDQNAVAKLLMFEYYRKPAETKKRNLDAFVEKRSAADKDKLELAARRVADRLDALSEIFLPRDQLLRSAGLVPVYYWFINTERQSDAQIREFLQSFDVARTDNRKHLANNTESKKVDTELVEFENYNRSTNDEQSHEGRIKILKRRFKAFRGKKS